MATDKTSAKTPTKTSASAARMPAGAVPVEMSITDDSPAASKAIQKLQRAIVDGLEDVKAQNIQVFNTAHMSPLFERVVIASGTSNRQTKALAASVRDAVRDAGFTKPRMEGEENGEWIIVDCGSAVVHIMQPAIRQYYTLEDIWGEKPVRLRMGAPAKAGEKKVSRTAARTAAKREAAAEEAALAGDDTGAVSEAPAKPARKTAAAKAPAAAKAAAPKAAAADAASTSVSRAKPAATRTAAAKPASARKTASTGSVAGAVCKSTAEDAAAPARKPAVRKAAARPASEAAADKPAKPRARKAPVVTVVVGKTVSKKAIKAGK